MTVTLEQLSAYHDGEMTHQEHQNVEVHVRGCPDCQAVLGRWQEASRALAARRPAVLRRRRAPALVLAGIMAILLVSSGVAVATGLYSEVFKIGNLLAAASRPVTLSEARITQLPLPASDQLSGGWKIGQVQLTMTEDWRSVDLQYRRPGSRGMAVSVWSQGINVNPVTERLEVVTVSGVPVEVGIRAEGLTARFTHRQSTVIIRAFASELGPDEITALVEAWIEQAR